eukprot:CAMPEP_0172434574 /NCGR_PEP_ID=MMETSP1064-20121228/70705_1 /TAXON_ID=202472 /ORGANISM="Aulacoseira subarctica , Strain CCAP 1002/5" /LENGTH=874 /DNA_ID=CAMNT_0013182807 /DNA_START=41 /DNA_END=2665 /DNA_ORIENTATION=-
MSDSLERATDPLGDDELDNDLQDKIASLISRCEQFNFTSSESIDDATVIDYGNGNDEERSLKEANEILRFEASNERQLRISFEVMMTSEMDVAMSKLRNNITEEKNRRIIAEQKLSSTEGAFKQHFYETAVIQEQAEKTCNELKAVIESKNCKLAESEKVLAKERELRLSVERNLEETKRSLEVQREQMRNAEQDSLLQEMALLNDFEQERESRLLVLEMLGQITTEKARLQKKLQETEKILSSTVATFEDEMDQAQEAHFVLERSLMEKQSQVESLLGELEAAKESFAIKEKALTGDLEQERHNRIRVEEMFEQQIDMHQNELKKKDEVQDSIEKNLNNSLSQERQLRLSMEQTLSENKLALEALQNQLNQNEQSHLLKVEVLTNNMKQERQHRILAEDEMDQAQEAHFVLERSLMEKQSQVESLLGELEAAKESFAIKEKALTGDLEQERHNRIRVEEMFEQQIDMHQNELKKKDEVLDSIEKNLNNSLSQERQLRLLLEQTLSENKLALEALQNQLNQNEQSHLLKVEVLTNNMKQERQHRILAEDEMDQAQEAHFVLERSLMEKQSQVESLLGELEAAKESFAIKEKALTGDLEQERHNRIRVEEMFEQQINMHHNELKKKDEVLDSIEKNLNNSLSQERQLRLLMEQTLSENKLALEALQNQLNQNQQNQSMKIEGLTNNMKQERQHRILAEEILKEMSNITRELQNQLKEKDELQSSMELIFKSGLEQEQERRLLAERAMKENKFAIETIQGEMKTKGQHLFSEAKDLIFLLPNGVQNDNRVSKSTPPKPPSGARKTLAENKDPNKSVITPRVLTELNSEQRQLTPTMAPRSGTPFTMKSPPMIHDFTSPTPSMTASALKRASRFECL